MATERLRENPRHSFFLSGKSLNIGARGGLVDEKHRSRMGDSIWLFLWCLHRQTTQNGTTGLVLSGHAVTYQMIELDTGIKSRTLRRWMARLKKHGYLEVTRAENALAGNVIRVLNAKKFTPAQGALKLSANPVEKLWKS